METLNNKSLDDRLEIYKAEILNIKKPQYQIGNMIGDKPGGQKFLLKRNVLIAWEMLDSAAFKTLSANAIRALIRFLQKRTWKGKGRNKVFGNTGLVFTYAEAEELAIGRSSFHSIIRRLFELGFIDIEHQGGGVAKDYSRYALSERWKAFGTPGCEPVSKKKVCRTGQDVHSRKQALLKQVTQKRNYQLRKPVSMNRFENEQGIAKL
jgi:hypothetical protein